MSTALRCLVLLAIAGVQARMQAEDAMDRVDDALGFSSASDGVRARISGSLDIEGYDFQRPNSGLIYSDRDEFVNPRLTVFLDAQIGPQVYVFAQARLDRGFDPANYGAMGRLDEAAVRFTPWEDGRLSVQIGKYATVVGGWVARHHAWDNPFVTAPLPYENLTGIFDRFAAPSADVLLRWAHVRPGNNPEDGYLDPLLRVPVIWGPSYASGASVSGILGRFEYAAEIKNASLSSREQTWSPAETQWQHPTFSGRIGWRPDARWNVGFSASTGSYLRPSAAPSLAPGFGLDDYREVVFGQDVSFAWHHVQIWAESFEARFNIPLVGDVATLAYYVEAKYRFTPRFSGALRWNQQDFSHVRARDGAVLPWGNDVWRVDAAGTYRFTAHTEIKLQASLQHDAISPPVYARLYAVQFVLRF